MDNLIDVLPPFPPDVDFETIPVFKALAPAAATLAELKGVVKTLPNPEILISALVLQEAMASSEIENIVTTRDDAFRADIVSEGASPETKEVARYRETMRLGYRRWRENKFISENMLIEMYRLLKQRDDGYRATPGVELRNAASGKVVYKPPQKPAEIVALMRQLEAFINADEPAGAPHPLIKMALIHHRFESIHPFSDGNGRIGRILNVLYLTHAGLLDTPVLYLSRAINDSKADYYRLLQSPRDAAPADDEWRKWVIYMLDAVASAAAESITLVENIRDLMAGYKRRLRGELPKLYSQDLLNNLFRQPYTRAENVAETIGATPQTARKHLEKLARHGFVVKRKTGRHIYYVNEPLVNLFGDAPVK